MAIARQLNGSLIRYRRDVARRKAVALAVFLFRKTFGGDIVQRIEFATHDRDHPIIDT